MERENYKGYTISIEQDRFAVSPDEWSDEGMFLTAEARRYFEVKRKGFMSYDIDLDKVSKSYDVFPLFAYIHSGILLSLTEENYPFNDQWDSGQIGRVFIQKTIAEKKKERQKIAQDLVNNWNDFLSGNVYCYAVEDHEGDIVASCGGFYGDPENALFEAKEEIDSLSDQLELFEA